MGSPIVLKNLSHKPNFYFYVYNTNLTTHNTKYKTGNGIKTISKNMSQYDLPTHQISFKHQHQLDDGYHHNNLPHM